MRGYTRISIANPDLLFFTSDQHFFHEKIISMCHRPFKDADEMTEALIRNWNWKVPPKGEVFLLGDIFWKKGDIRKCWKIMQRLNGRKWLIAGNHDLWPREEYFAMGFEEARGYLELSVAKQLVICCHYPLLEWNGFYHGSWHLHGHVHGRGQHFSHRVMDVGVDSNNYAPVLWRDVVKRLSGGWELDQQEMRERGNVRRHNPYSFEQGEQSCGTEE